jgi:dienelactone hydrolase
LPYTCGARRPTWLTGALLLTLAAAGGATGRPRPAQHPALAGRSAVVSRRASTGHQRRRSRSTTERPFAVGEQTDTFVDDSRRIRLPDGLLVPRRLVTIVRYPALGPPAASDRTKAPADRAAGPFGLVVFGHGFAVTPETYAALLRAWTRAGFVVAAPVFPLTNAHAPGGPDEADIINQPRDLRFVISRLLALSAHRGSALWKLIDPSRVAVSGQSDGGETALAAAYAPGYRDRRVRAAVILSGAELPRITPFRFPARSPPLLATQGTADTINRPYYTDQFFALTPRPKFLLRLLGAGHLPPYTTQQPQLGIVERASIAFLQRYLDGDDRALARLRRAARVRGVAVLDARP